MKMLLFVMFFLLLIIINDFSLVSILRVMNSGDVEVLGQYFDNLIELLVMENEDIYSKV